MKVKDTDTIVICQKTTTTTTNTWTVKAEKSKETQKENTMMPELIIVFVKPEG